MNGGGFVALGEEEVAGRKIADDELAVLDAEFVEVVADGFVVEGFEQREFEVAGCGGGFFERQADRGGERELESGGVVEIAVSGAVEGGSDVGSGDVQVVDGFEFPEIDAAVFIGADLKFDGGFVVESIAFQGEGARGERFAISAAEFEAVAGGGGGEEGGGDARELEVGVELVGFPCGEFFGVAAGGGGDGAAQGEREFLEVGGHEEGDFENGFESQVFGDDALGGDSA